MTVTEPSGLTQAGVHFTSKSQLACCPVAQLLLGSVSISMNSDCPWDVAVRPARLDTVLVASNAPELSVPS